MKKILAVLGCYIGTCHSGRCFFHVVWDPVMALFFVGERQVGVWHPESKALQLRSVEILRGGAAEDRGNRGEAEKRGFFH